MYDINFKLLRKVKDLGHCLCRKMKKMKPKEELLFCNCGQWHNTTVKCPNCGTVASKTLEEIRL